MKATDRVKTIMDAAPQQLLDRLKMTRKALNLQGEPYDEPVYDARAVVVSLNPDVVIVSLGERDLPRKPDEIDTSVLGSGTRRKSGGRSSRRRWTAFSFWLGDFGLYAGPLAPWADEMYAFSTDPEVGFRRVKFENAQATVPLPKGKLVLRRRDIDVDVSRE